MGEGYGEGERLIQRGLNKWQTKKATQTIEGRPVTHSTGATGHKGGAGAEESGAGLRKVKHAATVPFAV